jgi:hypothetical protein
MLSCLRLQYLVLYGLYFVFFIPSSSHGLATVDIGRGLVLGRQGDIDENPTQRSWDQNITIRLVNIFNLISGIQSSLHIIE